MSAVKAMIAAGALAALAAPATALAHGGVSVGFVFGSPGWYGPAYYPYYGPAYYGRSYYDYGPYYGPEYYDDVYYGPSYYYPRYHRHYRYHVRRYYHRTNYAVSGACHWSTSRYWERNGDYVIRHERSCR